MEVEHPIPQQISAYHFRLVGDMTLKQFFQVAAGALISLVLFSVAALVSLPAQAAGPAPDQSALSAQSGAPKGYRCHDEALTGSGPGFKSSRDESEEAAIADWLAKLG